MSRRILLVVAMVLALAGLAQAAEAKFLQLAVFNPIQMVPEDESIKGISLDLFYTVNNDFTGFAWSFIGVNRATGDAKGVQWGLGNWVPNGSVHGWQSGIANLSGYRFVGLQSGLVNMSKGQTSGVNLGAVNFAEGSFKGFQWGLFNYAAEMHGFQLGIVNWTKNLDGLQIGLGNYNGNKEPLEFMIIANWSF